MFPFLKKLTRRRPIRNRPSTYRCVLEQLEDRTAPATFTLNRTGDAVDATRLGDGRVDVDLNKSGNQITLRAAIQEANARSGHDKIKLGSGRYRLSIPGAGEGAAATGDLDITDNLTIIGAGAGKTTIDAQLIDRVFHIFPGATLNISGVTITGGLASDDPFDPSLPDPRFPQGGAFYNRGVLNISNSVITGNAANTNLGQGSQAAFGGAILNTDSGGTTIAGSTITGNSALRGAAISVEGGSVVINNSSVTDNSGVVSAIRVARGILTIDNSTIADNAGSGIENIATASVTASLVSGNSTQGGPGGGIHNTGLITIANTTISGNSAPGTNNDPNSGHGGGIYNLGSLAINSSTITNNTAVNGGGLWISAMARVTNTIIAGNTATATGADVLGGFALQNHNLIGGTGAGTIIDPLLGPLQDNGGPTFTHALLPDSPAIDAGDNDTAPPTDQRGVTRPQDGDIDKVVIADIGAFEREFVVGVPAVAGPEGVVDNNTPTISWTAVKGADRYEVWVADLTKGGAKAEHTDQATETSWTVSSPLSVGHSYKVWVRAHVGDSVGNWSSAVVFEVQPLLTPALTAPTGATLDRSPEFVWTAVDRAERYEIWINDLTAGQSGVVHTDQAAGTSWIVPTSLARNHAYRVWVRAHGEDGPSKWSDKLDFRVRPIGKATIVGPIGALADRTPTITWSDVEEADRFVVWINDVTAGKSKVAYTDQATGNSWKIAAPFVPGHSYKVWVRAVMANEQGQWSAPASFTVKSLDRPTIIGPIGMTRGATPEAYWSDDPIADYYEVWINDLTANESKVVYETQVSANRLTLTQLVAGHTYRMWVRAHTHDGYTGPWSSGQEFVVADSLLAASVGTHRMPHTDESLTIDLPQTDVNGNALKYSVAFLTHDELAFGLDEKFDFQSEATSLENWGGAGEKWLRAAGGRWYFILPSGRLYQWVTGATGANLLSRSMPIATLDASFFQQTNKLYDPQPPATDVTTSSSPIISEGERSFSELISLPPGTPEAKIVNGHQAYVRPGKGALGDVWLRLTVNNGSETYHEDFPVLVSELDTLSAMPGQLLAIKNPGAFDPDADHVVRFFNNNGFSLNVAVIDATASTLTVAVPPVLDTDTGQLNFGTVQLEVYQDSRPVSLFDRGGFAIEELPTPALPAGETTLAYLQTSLEIAKGIEGQLTATSLEAYDTINAVENQREELEHMIADVQAIISNPARTVSINAVNGRPIVFGIGHLATTDRLIAGMLSEQASLGTGHAVSSEARLFLDAVVSNPANLAAAQSAYENAILNSPVDTASASIKVSAGAAMATESIIQMANGFSRPSLSATSLQASAAPTPNLQGLWFANQAVFRAAAGLAGLAAITKNPDDGVASLSFLSRGTQEFMRTVPALSGQAAVRSADQIKLWQKYGPQAGTDKLLPPSACEVTIHPASYFWNDQLPPSEQKMRFVVTSFGTHKEKMPLLYSTIDDTAKGGTHFEAKEGEKLELTCGESKTIEVALKERPDGERVSFFVELKSFARAILVPPKTTGTIITAPVGDMPQLSFKPVQSLSIVEGDLQKDATKFVEFEVKLSQFAAEDIEFTYASLPVNFQPRATPLEDFHMIEKTGVIEQGHDRTTFGIAVFGDDKYERDEQFIVALTGVVNGRAVVPADETGSRPFVVTIIDNDEPPELQITPVHQDKFEDEPGPVEIKVELSETSEREVTFYYKTGGGSATPHDDYQAVDEFTKKTIAPGEKSVTIEIPIVSDTESEPNEQFQFIINNTDKKPVGASIGVNQATVTIVNDDHKPTVYSPIGDWPDRTPTFTWSSIPGAVSYEVWVSRKGETAKALYVSGVAETSWTTSTNLENWRDYRVWVRALRSNGKLSLWSDPVDFRIAINRWEGTYSGLMVKAYDCPYQPMSGKMILDFKQPAASGSVSGQIYMDGMLVFTQGTCSTFTTQGWGDFSGNLSGSKLKNGTLSIPTSYGTFTINFELNIGDSAMNGKFIKSNGSKEGTIHLT